MPKPVIQPSAADMDQVRTLANAEDLAMTDHMETVFKRALQGFPLDHPNRAALAVTVTAEAAATAMAHVLGFAAIAYEASVDQLSTRIASDLGHRYGERLGLVERNVASARAVNTEPGATRH